MIEYLQEGNLLDSPCDWLTVPVNCVGTMGAGLALQAARRYPVQEQKYKQLCKNKELVVGTIKLTAPLLLFPTKDHWKAPSTLKYIESGLLALRRAVEASEGPFGSIAIPALGCGLGSLEWRYVQPLVHIYLSDLPIDVEVYEPQ